MRRRRNFVVLLVVSAAAILLGSTSASGRARQTTDASPVQVGSFACIASGGQRSVPAGSTIIIRQIIGEQTLGVGRSVAGVEPRRVIAGGARLDGVGQLSRHQQDRFCVHAADADATERGGNTNRSAGEGDTNDKAPGNAVRQRVSPVRASSASTTSSAPIR